MRLMPYRLQNLLVALEFISGIMTGGPCGSQSRGAEFLALRNPWLGQCAGQTVEGGSPAISPVGWVVMPVAWTVCRCNCGKG
jgi:hypothetical protein